MNSFLTWQTGITVLLVVVAVVASMPDRRRLAALWAFLLPIDYVTGVPVGLLDGLRYGGVVVLALLFAPTLPAGPRRIFRHLGVVLLALAGVRGVAALAHSDSNGIKFAGVLVLATVVAYAMVIRPRIHPHLVAGYMAGLTLSVIVALMQALHWPTLREGNEQGQRYPGLSTYTMLLTWQLVIGLLVLAFVVMVRRTHRDGPWWVALALIPAFGLATVTNGAQGGLLGLAAALLAFVWVGRRRLRTASARRLVPLLLGLMAATALVATVSQVEVPTITDIGADDYRNERARFDIVFDGMREFRDHPLTGVSRSDFIEEYGIAPHFLPADSAAVSGVVGLVLSVYVLGFLAFMVLRGPADARAETTLGYLVVVVLTANTLTDSYGPFVGVARALPLWLALLAARGHWQTTSDDGADAQPVAEPEASATN